MTTDAHAVRRPARDRVDQRHPEGDSGRGRQALPRRRTRRAARAISYWLKSAPAGDVRDHDQRHHRARDPFGRGHRRPPACNRVQWDLTLAGGRGRGGRGGGAAGGHGGRRGAGGAEHRSRRSRGQARRQAPAERRRPAATGTAASSRSSGAGGGGRGGGGGGVPAGSYLVKVMVGDKVIGQKTSSSKPTRVMQ